MFKWKDNFSVNIKIIDEQHQELFRIGNALYRIISIKDGVDRYDEIMKILYEMRDYAIYHFDYEEKLMKENGYLDFENHKRQHNGFINKVKSIDELDVDEKQKKIGMELVIFIADWIENHILKSDMEYKDFLNSKGVM
ncbi:MAG: hemerythrin family protein [Tissierellia bacterium]|nr:hemerythrin family protein [Tissierellia bacterium]